MEHESHHHHHPHGTGVRWLDIALAVSATVVSLVSVYLALHSAHSMEKLVAANSYPYLGLMRSSGVPVAVPGTAGRAVEYELVNDGVGPARIEWVQMTFKGKPVADLTELFDACCGPTPQYDPPGLNRRGNVANALIRPGSSLKMFTWVEQATPSPTFDMLHRQMSDIKWSACYCSVFEECYVRASEGGGKPEPVKECIAPKVTFQPNFH